MLHKLIKESTAMLHAQLEQLMFVDEIMNGKLSFPKYKDILITNYLITAEYEPRLLEKIDSSALLRLEIHKRLKLDALLKDLADVEIKADDLKSTTGKLFGPAHALGCLYVLEGATLGGNIIARKLKENGFLAPYKLNFNYYKVYGEELISYWKQFCETINEQPAENYDEIIEGAKFMYNAFIELRLLVANKLIENDGRV